LFNDGNSPATWSAIADLDAEDVTEIVRRASLAAAKIATASADASARAAAATGASQDTQDAAEASYRKAMRTAEAGVSLEQADLLREIIGNPWRPVEPLAEPAAAVVQLAEALYAGEDCSFALHDALLEAGRTDLAKHFRASRHPRGCWALDAILSRG
jgi:hypothetical protein